MAERAPSWVVEGAAPGVLCLRLDDRNATVMPSFESWCAAGEELIALAARTPGGVVAVLDLTGGRPDAARRRQVFEWAAANRARFAPVVRAGAVVAPSPMLRGVLTAAAWFLPMKLPHRVFESYGAALAWAKEQARER